jgi:hypothetical protein
MTNRRADHAAVLLPGGRVLAAGGYMDIGSGQTGPGFTVEIYDAATGAWSPTGSMAVPRIFHTATTLQDGRVLVAGGDTGAEVTASAELYSLPSFVYLPLVFYSGE